MRAISCFKALQEARAHPDKAAQQSLAEAALQRYIPHVVNVVSAPSGSVGKGSGKASTDTPQATPYDKPGA